MSLLIIVEDDNGIMGKFAIADYDDTEDAQIAALDLVIDWFNDDESHDIYTDKDDVKRCIQQLTEFKVGVRSGQYDIDDEFEVSGFIVRSL